MHAQNWKVKTVDTGYTLKRFEVDKKTNHKDGYYIEQEKSNMDTLVYGHYTDNKKTGTWKFRKQYGFLEYNYDTRIFENMPDTVKLIDSAYVKVGEEFIMTKVDAPPLGLTHYAEIVSLIVNKKYNKINHFSILGKAAVSIVSAEVTTDGKLANIKIEQPSLKSFDYNVVITLRQLKADWIPARLNNEPVTSKIFFYTFVSKVGDVKPAIDEKLYNYYFHIVFDENYRAYY